jgi:hypothetical protein
VALGFARYGAADRGLERGVIRRIVAQGRAQVGHVFLSEAHVKLAGAGQAHAVAAFAEIMGERRDETDLLPGFFQTHIARRAAGALGQVGEGEGFGQMRAQVRQLPVLAQPVLVADIAHRHDLDEGQIHVARFAPLDQREQLVLVEALEGDGVDLDPQPGLLRGVDALDHLRQAAPAGDVGKFLLVERVERDVHPAHACGVEIVCETLKLAAIGGECEFLEIARIEMPGHGVKEGHDPLAHQGLAAGDAQFFHAHAHEGRAHAVELLERQQLFLGQEGHVFRHAIDAAKIAAVGHGDAQVGDGSLERVYERCCHGRNLSRAVERGKGDVADCPGRRGAIG